MGTTGLGEYEQIIQHTLTLVWLDYRRQAADLGQRDPAAFIPGALRTSPLGRDLVLLARVATGVQQPAREAVQGAASRVLRRLFQPVAAETHDVPRLFWEQPLGKMLSLAKYRSFEPRELLSIGQAASILQVTRPTIYRWMDDKSLDYVRDDMSGRTFIVRKDVEALRAEMEGEEASGRDF